MTKNLFLDLLECVLDGGSVLVLSRLASVDLVLPILTIPTLYGVAVARFVSGLCLGILALVFWFDLSATPTAQLLSCVVLFPAVCVALVLALYESIFDIPKPLRTLFYFRHVP
jgi:hypothetical protein